MSVLVHGAIFALLGWGWWVFRRPAPAAQPLAIEAQVIDSATLARRTAPARPAPPAQAPPPRQSPPPQSAPEPPAAKTPPEPSRAEQDRVAEQERRAERARAEKQEAERKARDAARRLAAAREARELQERRLSEADRSRREAELRAQMAAEERINAARGSARQAEYKALIEARINRAWIRPATARAGIHCDVRVTQVPGGEVVGVQVTRCNGDAAVRESIEAAVYRASPLPEPPDPDLFDRNLVVTFAPND
jgi:colicin import membrane protein